MENELTVVEWKRWAEHHIKKQLSIFQITEQLNAPLVTFDLTIDTVSQRPLTFWPFFILAVFTALKIVHPQVAERRCWCPGLVLLLALIIIIDSATQVVLDLLTKLIPTHFLFKFKIAEDLTRAH